MPIMMPHVLLALQVFLVNYFCLERLYNQKAGLVRVPPAFNYRPLRNRSFRAIVTAKAITILSATLNCIGNSPPLAD